MATQNCETVYFWNINYACEKVALNIKGKKPKVVFVNCVLHQNY